MKPIRLLVEMPSFGVFSLGGRSSIGPIEERIETTVDGLCRVVFKGGVQENCVSARAFVPERFRGYLREQKRLVDGEYVWCLAMVEHNRKSLAPFLASGDREWGEK